MLRRSPLPLESPLPKRVVIRTREATDLKNLFSKYGKVVGAKVVCLPPGAALFGFVTMSSSEEATKCISHLHRTELREDDFCLSTLRKKKNKKMKTLSKVEDSQDEKKDKGAEEQKSGRSRSSLDEQKPWREVRETERRRERERKERDQHSQENHESDERQRLQRERDRLHFQRQRLERERMERERLERERMRIEQERRREQERIHWEREELRRQQEQLRYEQDRRSALRRPYNDGRRDDGYWPEPKRMAMDDRYHSDFSRQDRFHSFDHRDRGRYHDHFGDRV
ncbi:hypothetical protein E2320_022275 [Naja naja]|nr:hypothetical protein E2320_022275 [Naja naja]